AGLAVSPTSSEVGALLQRRAKLICASPVKPSTVSTSEVANAIKSNKVRTPRRVTRLSGHANIQASHATQSMAGAKRAMTKGEASRLPLKTSTRTALTASQDR